MDKYIRCICQDALDSITDETPVVLIRVGVEQIGPETHLSDPAAQPWAKTPQTGCAAEHRNPIGAPVVFVYPR